MQVRNNFNLMRLLFAVGVVFSHSFGMVGKPEPDAWGLSLGGLGVHGFFVISGYLITASFQKTASVWIFTAHRLLRVLPGLLIVLMLMRLAWLACDRFVLILHNGPLWTLSWEGVCYAAVAAAGVLGLLNKRAARIIFAVAWIVYLANASSTSEAVSIAVPMLMLFVAGAFIKIVEDEIDVPRLAKFSILVLAVLFVPGVFGPVVNGLRNLGFTHGTFLSDWQIHEIPYLLAFPFVVIYLGLHAPVVANIKNDLSYGIYIYGWPTAVVVGYIAYNKYAPIDNPIIDFAIVMPIVVVLACFSWFAIEKPALRAKRRLDAPVRPGRTVS